MNKKELRRKSLLNSFLNQKLLVKNDNITITMFTL